MKQCGDPLIRTYLLVLLLILPFLSSCAGAQSSIDPAGPDAAHISTLLWLMVAISTAVFVMVMLSLAYAVFRGRHPDTVANVAKMEWQMKRSVSIAIGATVIILFALLVTDVYTGRALTSKREVDALKIDVTGHQWWWEVMYEDPMPARMMKTANEIHVPTGQLIKLKLASHDVIHSFWAPNFAGKKDLIPGHETTLFLQANRPGVFRGQCAEFCGHQHAHMAFDVIVQTPDEFAAWYEQQLQPAPTPLEDTQKRGQRVFLTSRCVMCHAIAGTSASATAGPDLTHVGSRRTIAAGTLPNTPEHLENWVRDSQSVKPGNKMPRIELSEEDLHAVLAYLETLK